MFAVLLVIWTNVDIKPELEDTAFGGIMCGGCTFCFENRKAWFNWPFSGKKTTTGFCNTPKHEGDGCSRYVCYIHRLAPKDSAPFGFVEIFAGQAETTRMFTFGGFKTAKLDLMYMSGSGTHQNPMDLTSDAGMASLNSK